jgi:hypothetical protein
MNKTIFFLSSAGPFGGKPCEQPVWSNVESQIERTFSAGGSVELAFCEKVYEPKEQNIVLDTIHMDALPGMFRIIVIPRRKEGEKKSTIREWWEPGDTQFRGGKKFGDDEWDLRTICTDVLIAKVMFQDFFDHYGVSDVLLRSTQSIWDKSSWIKPAK